MSTNRLWLAALALGLIDVASGCQSGGTRSGTIGADGADFNGLGGGPGFGSPGHSATPGGSDTSSGVEFSPGFGAPSHPAYTGAGAAGNASVGGLLPGFGSPSGSSANAGGVPPRPGTPPAAGGQRISDLSESEAEQLCTTFAQQVNQTLGDGGIARLSCTFAALFQSAQEDDNGQQTVDRAACELAFDACVARGSTDTGAIECDRSEFLADAEDCDATVSQVQSCISASLELTSELLSMFNCQTVTDPIAAQQALGANGGTAPECASLEAECPGLLDTAGADGSSGTGGSGGTGGSDGPAGSGGSDAEPPPSGCENTCFFADDDECDDGGPDSITSACVLGTDCGDCGPR
jgi:hypothetical protein